MTLTADSSGVVRGKFTIPASVPSGNKRVTFSGGGGQSGAATFSGQGKLEHQTFQQRTDITEVRWQSPPPPPPPDLSWMLEGRGPDPIAQTFTMNANTQIAGLDLWFATLPTTQTNVQIRETTAGFPNQSILADATVLLDDIVVDGAPTRVQFAAPVLLLNNVEYAIVVLCGDADGALSVAEIGKFDPVALRWITSQPYTVGVLLSSSNASTWTAHQDRDMTFRLLESSYSQTQRVVPLGSVAVTAATDLLLMSYADRPDGSTDVQYTLTLPDATVITVADGQPVQLAAPLTGAVAVAAILRGTARFSPVLHPGTQLVAGQVAATADYVSRAIPGGADVSVKAIYEAFIPSGATVTVQYKGPDVGDAWIDVAQTATRAVDDGFVEFTHSVTGVNELTVQIKLILTGTTAARPRVRDLRTFVL